MVGISRHGQIGERTVALLSAVRALIPRWIMTGDPAVGLPRRVVWGARDWLLAAAGLGDRFTYLAKRRGLLDYLRGRLGPTPRGVLELNRRWQARQPAPTPASRTPADH
jgi:hypothetical protein